MNPFIETFTPSSSRTVNRRKHEDSYFLRLHNNTVEWVSHQSTLEQFFYFLVLIVFVLIFTAIYFIYTKHYVFHSEPLVVDSATPTPSKLPTTTRRPKQMKLKVRTTTTPRPLDENYHGHYHGHHPPITISTAPITAPPISLSTEIVASKETSTSSTVKTTTALTIQPTVIVTSTPTTTKKEDPPSSNTYQLITDSSVTSNSMSIPLVDVRGEFDKLIDAKIADSKHESRSENDSHELLKLAKQMKRNEAASSCSFMGFNHLSVPIDFQDYYWYKPQTESFNSTELNLWGWFDPPCLSNCSRLSESIQNKLNQFWSSCMTKNQTISDFKRLIIDLGFDSDLPKNVTKSDVNKLLKSLDYRGLFNFKLISDPSSGQTIRLVARDDHPFLRDGAFDKIAEDLAYNEIAGLGGPLNGSDHDTLKETLIEALQLSETIQNIKLNETNKRISPRPKSFSHLDPRNFLIDLNADDLIELESGFVHGALTAVNDYQPVDLYYYLLFTYLKKNAIHLNSHLFAFHSEYTDLNIKDVPTFCRNLVSLPFGLVLLKDHFMRIHTGDETDLISTKLADYVINNLIDKMTNKLPSELIRRISFIAFEQLAVNQIVFDDNHIEQLYSALHITDNHFDNVQSIRSWLQSGYNESCLLNYASI